MKSFYFKIRALQTIKGVRGKDSHPYNIGSLEITNELKRYTLTELIGHEKGELIIIK